MKIFNVFGFLNNQNNLRKQNNQKLKLTRPQIIERIKQGQVNNTHLREYFLTHIAQVFGFVGENL